MHKKFMSGKNDQSKDPMSKPEIGISHMPKRPTIIYPASPNLNNTETLIVPCKGSVKILVQGHELDTSILNTKNGEGLSLCLAYRE